MSDSFSDTSQTTLPPDESRSGILLFNQKRYAVGLNWFTAEAHSDTLINSRAKKIKADFYTVRSSVVVQHAFGHLSKGHSMGMPSAAAIAADTLFGEWHGIFAADNGWWYLAVHSDSIAPDGDLLFESEEDAYNYFIKHSKEFQWTRSYAPSVWNLPDSVADLPLDKLLESSNTAAYLRPINLDAIFGGSRQKKAALITGIFFLCLAFMLALLPAFVTEAELPQRNTVPVRITAPDIIAPPPREIVKEPLRKINYAGLRLPLPSAFIGRCMEMFDQIAHPIPGWPLSSMDCNNVQAAANWQGSGGSLVMLKEALPSFPKEATKHFSGQNEFKVYMSLPTLQDIEIPVSVLKKEDIIFLINKRLSGIGQLKIQHIVPKAQPETVNARSRRSRAVQQQPAEPPYLQATLLTKMPASMITTLFDLPGLNVQNIKWDLKSKIWTYEMKVLIDSPELRQAQGMP